VSLFFLEEILELEAKNQYFCSFKAVNVGLAGKLLINKCSF